MTTPAPEPTPSAKLRVIASRVRRLAVSGRTDPERVLVEKDDLARQLAHIARELERPMS